MNKKTKLLLQFQIFILIGLQIMVVCMFDIEKNEHLLLIGVLLAVVMITLFTSTLGGLIFSLLFIFGAGTLLLLQSTTLFLSNWQAVTDTEFIIFGGALIVTIILTGSIQEKITQLLKLNEKYQHELAQFVSIDSQTSFDTLQRMEIEVKREMNRVYRHGGSFILLYCQIDFFHEFKKTYGQREVAHLLETIGAKVNASVRSTDRKFRVREDRFAILLVETNTSFIEVITGNLLERLKTHQLLNGKTVTLSFHISYEDFDGQTKGVEYEKFIEGLENEIVFYAM